MKQVTGILTHLESRDEWKESLLVLGEKQAAEIQKFVDPVKSLPEALATES